MNVTAQHLRSIGWLALLLVCGAAVMVMAFRVNALRSQVHQSDARIIALREETLYLETEFETRANQQQLKAWNDVDFGYVAPNSTQYLDGERQLAAYSKPVEPGAPAPIRVASADDSVAAAAAFPAMVSPMTGKPIDAEKPVSTRKADTGADADPESDESVAPTRAEAHKIAVQAGAAHVANSESMLGRKLALLRHDGDIHGAGAKHAKPVAGSLASHVGPAHDRATHDRATHDRATHDRATHDKVAHDVAYDRAIHAKPGREKPDHDPDHAPHHDPHHDRAGHAKATPEKAAHDRLARDKPVHDRSPRDKLASGHAQGHDPAGKGSHSVAHSGNGTSHLALKPARSGQKPIRLALKDVKTIK